MEKLYYVTFKAKVWLALEDENDDDIGDIIDMTRMESVACYYAFHDIQNGCYDKIIVQEAEWKDYIIEISYLSKRCKECLLLYGDMSCHELGTFYCDHVSHKICEGLASPLHSDWKDQIEWQETKVPQLE